MAITNGYYIDSFSPEANRMLESDYSKNYDWLEEDVETNWP